MVPDDWTSKSEANSVSSSRGQSISSAPPPPPSQPVCQTTISTITAPSTPPPPAFPSSTVAATTFCASEDPPETLSLSLMHPDPDPLDTHTITAHALPLSLAPDRRSSRLDSVPVKRADVVAETKPMLMRRLAEDFMFVPTSIVDYRWDRSSALSCLVSLLLFHLILFALDFSFHFQSCSQCLDWTYSTAT